MEIIWSDLARQNLDSILDYVEDNFGINTANKTLLKISEKVEGLRNFLILFTTQRFFTTELLCKRLHEVLRKFMQTNGGGSVSCCIFAFEYNN